MVVLLHMCATAGCELRGRVGRRLDAATPAACTAEWQSGDLANVPSTAECTIAC